MNHQHWGSIHRRLSIQYIILFILSGSSGVWAGMQEAWIQKYNAGRTKGTNQAVAMAFDPQGNIVVAGSSTSAQGDFDYVTAKYASNGSNMWVQRYASPGNGDDQLKAIAFDKDSNVYVTGSSATVKYDQWGTLIWLISSPGKSVATDSGGNVYITGASEVDFFMAKITSSGSNEWSRTSDFFGLIDKSLKVAVGHDDGVFLVGSAQWMCQPATLCYSRFGVVKYDTNGTFLWSTTFPPGYYGANEVKGVVFFGENIAIAAKTLGFAQPFLLCGLNSDGAMEWSQDFGLGGTQGVEALQVWNSDTLYLTGARFRGYPNVSFATYRVAAEDGKPVWEANYSGPSAGYHRANAIGLDAAGNVYVAGQSTGAGTVEDWQDWATIKYSPDGKEQWVKRYNGPAQLYDVATCMAVAPSGEVYVAGWSQTSSNLVELVVIKYAELANVQMQEDGTASLQFFGTPGQSYRIDASTNIPNWEFLTFLTADPNGIYRYEDTNAPNFPQRFYRTGPQSR